MIIRSLLLVLACLQSFTMAQDGAGPKRCCISFQSHRISLKFITAYEETDRQCTKAGVIFTLKDGRQVCGDPNLKWVKNIMEKIDWRLISNTTQPSASAKGPEDCCFNFFKKPIPIRAIKTFENTSNDCPKSGVILTTQNSSRVCVDPGFKWVQRAIEVFDQRLYESSS